MAMATTPGGGNPLEVFPVEVWEIILEHLGRDGSSRDILNTSLACTEFQKILKQKTKVKWMFGSVLPFICPYIDDYYEGRAAFLACCRVCKNWQHGVDKFLDDSEIPLWKWLSGESAIQEFLKGMRQQKMETPFALRSLCFSEWGNRMSREMSSAFWEKALVLLSLYGDQIWNLRVAPRLYDPQRFYEILRQALEFTPNLKCLEVGGSYEFFESNEETHSVRLQKLEEHLENHPLPKIDSLKTLEVNTSGHLFPFVMSEKLISDINPEHLKCLTIDYNSELVENMIPIRKPLLSLTTLRVSWGRSLEKLEHIFDKISPTAPLEYLELRFGSNFDGIDCARICKAINKFKWTLKTLLIDVRADYYYCTEALTLTLSLSELETPNLKILEVRDIVVDGGSLPPSLEELYLHWVWVDSSLSLDPPQRDFYKSIHDAGGLKNLPIWDEMRNLKVMEVELYWEDERRFVFEHDYFCTREMHEDAVKNRGQL